MRLTRPIIVASLALIAVAGVGGVGGCHPQRDVTRVDPNTVIDLDYRFSADDARFTYQAMVNDAMYRTWIDRWYQGHAGAKPVVVIGPVKNETQDYINTKLFTDNWQRELLNADRVRFVAGKEQRPDIREERAQGQEWNTPETRKQMRAELGADLILAGAISDNKQRSLDGKTMVTVYSINLTLTNLESNEILWNHSFEIKKLVRDH